MRATRHDLTRRAALAVLCSGAALLGTACGSTKSETTSQKPESSSTAPSSTESSSTGASSATSKQEATESAISTPGLVAPDQVEELLAAHPGMLVIDVRTSQEVAAGHLPQASLNLDFKDPGFAAAVDKLDKQGQYLVYCHSGNRSAQAVSLMRDQGFTQVWDLEGGITRWQADGLPTVTTPIG